MSIRLTVEQIDGIAGDLLFRCDACEDVAENVFRQGENDGNLSRVDLALTPSTLTVDLCRSHLREFRPYVTHGAMFCGCGGIVERTGNTKPIENGDGVWEEYKCERFDEGFVGVRGAVEHYHEWDPLD